VSDLIAFKVLTAGQLAELEDQEAFAGAPGDLADGYIHMSTAAQLDETVARHFAGQTDLTIAAVDLDALGEAVRWEVSREGQLFPHLYGTLTLDSLVAYGPLEREDDGSIRLPVAG
jgi:uncharacterized protein (DUF952 family)